MNFQCDNDRFFFSVRIDQNYENDKLIKNDQQYYISDQKDHKLFKTGKNDQNCHR